MSDESKDLKTGMTTTYEIEGKKVVLKPTTLGKMKKAMAAFQKKNADTFDMMQDHIFEILNNGFNDFATKEWIADNISLPMASQIINDMRAINGLGNNDFFQTGGAKVSTENQKEIRDLTEKTPTPSV